MSDMEQRVRRLERQVRILVALLCTAIVTALAVGSIAASHAEPSIITAQEVRAQRFTLLGPKGDVFDYWYSTPTQVIKP
jgi:hypothetical protein